MRISVVFLVRPEEKEEKRFLIMTNTLKKAETNLDYMLIEKTFMNNSFNNSLL